MTNSQIIMTECIALILFFFLKNISVILNIYVNKYILPRVRNRKAGAKLNLHSNFSFRNLLQVVS